MILYWTAAKDKYFTAQIDNLRWQNNQDPKYLNVTLSSVTYVRVIRITNEVWGDYP